MSNNQNHGFMFEDLIKTKMGVEEVIPYTEIFDIPVPLTKINTSVKTTKTNTVCLGDASRVFSYETDVVFVVGKYKQNSGEKVFNEIYEILVKQDDWAKLRGDISAQSVSNFHEGIRSFGVGEHLEARKFSREMKSQLNHQCQSVIKLNPKIDSKTQRRLQCSVGLDALLENASMYKVYDGKYGDINLPLSIESSSRVFNKRENNE